MCSPTQREEGRPPGLQPLRREQRLWIQVPESGWATGGYEAVGGVCGPVSWAVKRSPLPIRLESCPRGKCFWPGFEALLTLTAQRGARRPEGSPGSWRVFQNEQHCAPQCVGIQKTNFSKKPFIFGF